MALGNVLLPERQRRLRPHPVLLLLRVKYPLRLRQQRLQRALAIYLLPPPSRLVVWLMGIISIAKDRLKDTRELQLPELPNPAFHHLRNLPTVSGVSFYSSYSEVTSLCLDISHWDCFDTAAEAEEASSSEETGECIIHGK
jgi:hypothetical protein